MIKLSSVFLFLSSILLCFLVQESRIWCNWEILPSTIRECIIILIISILLMLVSLILSLIYMKEHKTKFNLRAKSYFLWFCIECGIFALGVKSVFFGFHIKSKLVSFFMDKSLVVGAPIYIIILIALLCANPDNKGRTRI